MNPTYLAVKDLNFFHETQGIYMKNDFTFSGQYDNPKTRLEKLGLD